MDANTRTRKVTAQQVAARAGVSISAVSRAFTEGASISADTHRKVMKAAQALGYQPNIMARSLMTGRTDLIGLVSNNFDNPAFMEIFALFTRLLQAQDLKPLLVNLSGETDPQQAVSMLRQYNVDAVIVASSAVAEPFMSGCIAAGIPVVHAFGKAASGEALHVVSADNVQGGMLAAETLLQHGYRRMAFLGGPRTASSTADRLRGFRAGLKAVGLTPVVEAFAKSYAHDEGRRVMLELLARKGFQAVFCGDDILAMGALDACREHGTKVPADIGILGFNDIAMASWPAFDLSTIRQPISEIISAAVNQAIKLLADRHSVPLTTTLQCEVVLRRTLWNA
jgi:DNA-binding LacI/PurR family transcriptional regulator